jgi:hypothetical protein
MAFKRSGVRLPLAPPISSLDPDQRRDLVACVVDKIGWRICDELRAACFPRYAAQLISKHNAGNDTAGGNRDLEPEAFRLVGNRARDTEPGALVVRARTQYDRRTPPPLFVALGRAEIDRDEIPGFRAI